LTVYKDPVAIERSVRLIKSDRAVIRKLGVEILMRFMEPEARHDILSDYTLAKLADASGEPWAWGGCM